MLPYAISKLASEQYVRFFAERRGQPSSYVNVRFFGAYGPYEPDRKITTRWLLALAAGQREFMLRGDGQNLIDFMYVNDAVDGLLKLVERPGERLTVDFASGSPVRHPYAPAARSPVERPSSRAAPGNARSAMACSMMRAAAVGTSNG